MGEVHANNIETSCAELVDGLHGVRLGANCADNRGSAVVLGRLELDGTRLSALFFINRTWERPGLSRYYERITSVSI
jgi:hypothetical protein